MNNKEIKRKLKEISKKLTPTPLRELQYYLKYRKKRLHNFRNYQNILRDKNGVEIGGPSMIFKTCLPVYAAINNLDGVNFSGITLWTKTNFEEKTFNYYLNKTGRQFITEATNLKDLKSNTYDFLLSSNCLEHIANPLKALEEWVRVIMPNGYLLLVLPNKKSNFDHKRPITTFEHLLEDYKSNITEHDLTHLNEILGLHDLSRDPNAGNYENFKTRSLNNFSNRGLHHHVFDMALIKKLFGYFNIGLIETTETDSDYFALGKVMK